MKITLEINLPSVKKANEAPKQRDIVWPTFIPEEEAGIPSVEFEMFDGSTAWDEVNKVWTAISNYSKASSKRATGEYTYAGTCYDFYFNREKHTTEFVMNDPGINESILATEYGPDNIKRWKRMPLEQHISRDGLNRIVETSGPPVNYRIALTQGGRAVFDYSHDLKRDGFNKGPVPVILTTPQQADGSFVVRDGMAPRGAFGIKFGEHGARFLNHYVDSAGEVAETNKYTAQWFTPDSLYWKAFDTDDSENFKVTLEPSFDADAVDGKLIMASVGKTNVKVYWMPKDWAYIMRYTKDLEVIGAEDAEIATMVYEWSYGRPPFDTGSYGDWCDQGGLGPPPCNGEQIHYDDNFTLSGWWYVGTMSEGFTFACDWEVGIWACCGGVMWQDKWTQSPFGCNAGNIASLGCIGDCTPDHHLDYHVGWCCWGYHHAANELHFTHQISIKFDRPYWALGPPASINNGYWTDEGQVFQHRNNAGLIGDEGLVRARENYAEYLVTQGYSEAQATAKAKTDIPVGFHSYQDIIDFYMMDCTNNFKTGEDSPMGWEEGADEAYRWAVWNTLLYSPPLSGDFSEWWNTWGFDFMNPSNPGVPAGLPLAIGVAPDTKGTLCAIIRINESQVYYVWRKTNEEFTTCSLDKGPGGGVGKASTDLYPPPEGFKGTVATDALPQLLATVNPAWIKGMNGGEMQFSGENGALTAALVSYGVHCVEEHCNTYQMGASGACALVGSSGATAGALIKVYVLFPHLNPPSL